MKTVKILGTGCPKCNQLERNVREAVARLGADIVVEKVTAVADIMRYGVMITPTLVVDEKVVSSGKVLPVDQLEEILS